MNKHHVNRLLRALKASPNLEGFIHEVVRRLKWYHIPTDWTKKDLIDFYQLNGGKN